MWSPYKGKYKLNWYPKKASTILSFGALVDVVDGYVEICTITRQSHSGIVQKTITATDSDYASTTLIPVLVPTDPTFRFKVSVLSTDTAVATDVGNFFDVGGTPVGIDVTRGSSDDDVFLVTNFLGANLVAGHLNAFKPLKNGIGTAV